MAMLTAYFDESGIHPGNHVCVVGGFIGNDVQWTYQSVKSLPAGL